MHVSLAFDLAFARYAMATMRSILDKGISDGEAVSWWFTPAPDVPQAVLDAFVREGERRGEVHLLRVPEELDALPLSSWRIMSSRITHAAYYRLLLPELVPDTVPRMLYVDGDVLCMGGLTELWETDLGDDLLAAAVDIGSPTVSAAGGLPGFAAGAGRLTFWSDYFNSGVLLMDLARCREEKIAARSLDYLRDNAPRLRFAVQDAMNITVDDRWVRLDPRWNDMDFAACEREGESRGARLIQFAGAKKPWQDAFPEGELKTLFGKYLPAATDLGIAR
ncbi:glycosyltransferase family 8 protein [Spongiactinospora sp. 9N601]|uniref:glycosyltransferase family 8 protein n=1 Tax=Spongiactinospora sp. 9N601 TaxID=3375149 RepID=UPI0037A683A3